MFSNMDPEARVYLVMVIILLALWLTTTTAMGWMVRNAEREEAKAKKALARAVKEERRYNLADVAEHFEQTPYGRHAQYTVGVADPDATLVHTRFGFGGES